MALTAGVDQCSVLQQQLQNVNDRLDLVEKQVALSRFQRATRGNSHKLGTSPNLS